MRALRQHTCAVHDINCARRVSCSTRLHCLHTPSPSWYIVPVPRSEGMACVRFFMLRGDPTETVPKLVEDTGTALLVTDFAPLRLGREWRQKVCKSQIWCI